MNSITSLVAADCVIAVLVRGDFQYGEDEEDQQEEDKKHDSDNDDEGEEEDQEEGYKAERFAMRRWRITLRTSVIDTQGPPTGCDSPSSVASGRNRENSVPLHVPASGPNIKSK